jgi:MFS family permease
MLNKEKDSNHGMARKYVGEVLEVWRRQRRNWKTIVIRQVFNRFFFELTRGYSNIYITLLGASPVSLGIVNSFTGFANTAISVPVGWLQDRYSLRKLFIMGVGLLALVPLIYALASDWLYVIPAIIIAAFAIKEGSCLVLCNICLENRDRLTAKSICEGLGRIPTLAAPIVAAFIVDYFGGITVEGIRPLFWLQFAARSIMFFFIAIKLKEISRPKQLRSHLEKSDTNFLDSFKEIFQKSKKLKRWILFSSVTSFSQIMMLSFRYPYAHEIKGANQFVIGGLATASVLLQIIFYTPLGRLSDRIGRKKTLYLLIPLVWASNLLFVLAPTPEILVLSMFLYGFEYIVIVTQNALSAELVSSAFMGRWIGVLGFFTGLVDIPAPIIGGLIWEHINPAYIFLIPIVVDVLVRLPILRSMPETLFNQN